MQYFYIKQDSSVLLTVNMTILYTVLFTDYKKKSAKYSYNHDMYKIDSQTFGINTGITAIIMCVFKCDVKYKMQNANFT